MTGVRVAAPQDADAVTALLTASYTALMPAAYDAATLAAVLPLITVANPALLAGGTYFVVPEGDRLVGAGGWSLDRPGTGVADPGIAHIRHFATHPDATGRGIGRAIYQACAVAAGAAGAGTLECYASLNAVPFYAAVGFRRVRDIDVPMPGGVILPAVLMTRPL